MEANRKLLRLLPGLRWRASIASRRIGRVVHDYARRRSASNRLAAAVYYGFFNHQHMREARAVAAGQVRYAQDHRSDAPSYYLLRRNIHRLEKGLIMRPRRPIFAADFILETVDIFKRAVLAAGGGWNSEIVWADDVLTDYFAAVDLAPPPDRGGL